MQRSPTLQQRMSPGNLNPSFVERLRITRQNIKPSDPWTTPLRNIRGQVGHDRVERINTDAVFEHLDIPRLQANTGSR